MDVKCRISFPANLRKQLPEGEDAYFVVNKSLDQNCINLYTKSEWEKLEEKLSKLHAFNPKIEKLKRILLAGSARLELDSAGRLLLPKVLVEGVGLKKEVIILAQINKIEIWDKANYDAYLEANSKDLAALATEIFGENFEF